MQYRLPRRKKQGGEKRDKPADTHGLFPHPEIGHRGAPALPPQKAGAKEPEGWCFSTWELKEEAQKTDTECVFSAAFLLTLPTLRRR